MIELNPKPATDDPNTRWTNTFTWSSTSDVDTFFNRFNHDNNYYDGDIKLGLGDRITINDGTYNVDWMIAGFDMEYNQTAADYTTYNNGYGICMIPKDIITNAKWNDSDTLIDGYMSSTMHTSHLPSIVTKLQTVLGSHIVNRNVLLSSDTSRTNRQSYAYTWTTAYATLMSIGQMTGTFASHTNKYDDGEANYKLPLFNYVDYKNDFDCWTRGIQGYKYTVHYVYCVTSEGIISGGNVIGEHGVRPLIYLR